MECCQSRSVEETSRAEEEEEKVESRLRWSSIFGVSRARNRWTKWFPVSFTFAWNLCVWACLQLAVGGRAMCSARAWRERRQCTFPAESFRRESSAHHAREWVRSFPSVECCSTGSISATIPEAPRLLLLNGYSCFWKDPLPYENERCNKWWIKTRHLLSFYFGFGKCLAFWDTKVMKLNTHYIYRDEVLYICFVSQVKIWIFFKDKELSCEENYAPLEKSIKYRYIYVNVLWLV